MFQYNKLAIILSIFSTKIVFALAGNDINGYCDISSENCIESQEDADQEKLIFYDVNPPEGFNLRRDVYMRFAIMLSGARKSGRKLHWHLVLPPWYSLYHWKYTTGPIPWGEYFDLKSLKSYAPVLELWEVFARKPTKKLEIDRLYFLQNYPDPFEGGTFVDKWEIDKKANCNYDGYWGYENITAKEIVCVKFQGKISQLWQVASLHPKDSKIMFAHGEIPLHETYGTKPFWDCRKSMKFNEDLVEAARLFRGLNLKCYDVKCRSYIAVHWRRQDFLHKKDLPSIASTADQIYLTITDLNQYVPDLNISTVYLATDATFEEYGLLKNVLEKYEYEVVRYKPNDISNLRPYKYGHEGHLAIIDQIICSHAYYFIGTRDSTFTFRIQEEREILGFNSDTTFNVLCKDYGICEEPSRWTIVH